MLLLSSPTSWPLSQSFPTRTIPCQKSWARLKGNFSKSFSAAMATSMPSFSLCAKGGHVR